MSHQKSKTGPTPVGAADSSGGYSQNKIYFRMMPDIAGKYCFRNIFLAYYLLCLYIIYIMLHIMR